MSSTAIGAIIESDNADKPASIGSVEPKDGANKDVNINGFPVFKPGDVINGSEDGTGSGSGTGSGYSSSGAGDSAGRKRGRPAGSKNRTATGQSEKAVSNLGELAIKDLLLSITFMGSKFMNLPELEIDEEEAIKLDKSLTKLAAFYPMGISPKKLAWAEFISTSATIFGTRAIAITRNRMKKELTPGKPIIVKTPAGDARPGAQPTKQPELTNPSQIWSEGGGVEGEIREGT